VAAARRTAPGRFLLVGSGLESTRATVAFTQKVADLGADAVLVLTPCYYKNRMTVEALRRHYEAVADASPVPVYLYSVPAFTGLPWPAELTPALAKHPRIRGIKESSGNVEKVAAMVQATKHIKRTTTVTEVQQAVTERMLMARSGESDGGGQLVSVGELTGSGGTAVATTPKIKTRTKEVGFQILVGAAHTLLDSLQVGASGGVLGFAAPAPTICFEIYAAFRDNDLELARSKQQKLEPATKRVVSQMGIPAVKYAMDLNGYYGGPPRLPLLPLSAAQKTEVEEKMALFRN